MIETNWELLLRLILSAILGGVIGYERELKGRDAGIRTHTLVSLGAAIITLTQLEASEWVIDFAENNPDLPPVVTTDITRLTAQIVNGIGFLGAGTIIVSKRSVRGLTTAASIWAVASLGIAIGMGYYFISIISTIIMLVVLRVVKNLFKIEKTKQLVLKYANTKETLDYLDSVFDTYNVIVVSADHSISYSENSNSTCSSVYTLHLPDPFNMMEFLSTIGDHPNLIEAKTIKADFDN